MASTIDTLNSIASTGNTVVALAAVGVPLVKGVIIEVKQMIDANGQATEDYQVVLTVSNKNLDEADENYQEAIDKINAELTRQGKPTI